jgi:NAD(P)-dependent dehydrogenase (short-subunit alcohol dehydrogenase family)
LTQYAKQHLAKTQGNVVNITSVLASLPVPVGPYYTTSKAGLEHYTRSTGVSFAPNGIRVNAVRFVILFKNERLNDQKNLVLESQRLHS